MITLDIPTLKHCCQLFPFLIQQLKGKKISTAEDTDGEQLVEVLRAQATNYGVTTSKIEEFNKALEANGGKLDDATAAILTNAIAEKNAEKAYAKTSEEIREVTDDYEDLKDITEEDTQLIGEALGLTDLEVGSENFNFVKENLDLIAQAAEGDIEAFDRLQEKLAEQVLEEIPTQILEYYTQNNMYPETLNK